MPGVARVAKAHWQYGEWIGRLLAPLIGRTGLAEWSL
jgi:hypothetical protein